MEDKYGRLFTESDALGLIQGAFEMGAVAGQANSHLTADELQANYPAILEILAHRRMAMRFPANEPLFLLRAKDTLSLATIRHYRRLCLMASTPIPHIEAVDAAAGRFWQWQVIHPDQMKVPTT